MVVACGVAVVALLAGVGWFAIRSDVVPFLAPDQCTAEVGDHSVVLDPSQARYAGLITAIAVQRGMPARAASIALAAAYQESDLRNLERRRPRLGRAVPAAALAGLGHARRGPRPGATRPTRSTTRWRRSTATSSSRSPSPRRRCSAPGFPDAYADHEADARTLASALSGNSPEAFSCRLGDSDDESTAAQGVRADRPRGRRTPRPRRAVPRPAARRLRARRGLDRSHGGVGALRRPRDRPLRPAGLAGQQDPRLGDRAVPRQPGRPALHQDGDLRRPDLDAPAGSPATAGATTTRPSAPATR